MTRRTLAASDPRVPGGVYHCSFWRKDYEVLAMWTPHDADILWFQVMWSDGEVTVHCTPWDGSDSVVSVP